MAFDKLDGMSVPQTPMAAQKSHSPPASKQPSKMSPSAALGWMTSRMANVQR